MESSPLDTAKVVLLDVVLFEEHFSTSFAERHLGTLSITIFFFYDGNEFRLTEAPVSKSLSTVRVSAEFSDLWDFHLTAFEVSGDRWVVDAVATVSRRLSAWCGANLVPAVSRRSYSSRHGRDFCTISQM